MLRYFGSRRIFTLADLLITVVMAGLVPAAHVFDGSTTSKAWMPGTSPGMTNWSNETRVAQ
jgi:hypothetical protein